MHESENYFKRNPDVIKRMIYKYFRYGSVEAAMLYGDKDFCRSLGTFRDVLKDEGIVEFAGRHSKLSETLFFFSHLVEERIPLESLYKRMPSMFRTSFATLHRIFERARNGIVGRRATALVITPEDNPYALLVGADVSTPRPEIGKPMGAITVSATFSKWREDPRKSILRVLQQEAFTDLAIEKAIPQEIIPPTPTPFMYLDITDIRVSVFHISIQSALCDKISTPKLFNPRFIPVSEIIADGNKHLRAGMQEIGIGYWNLLANRFTTESTIFRSKLNQELALLPAWRSQERCPV